MSGNFYEVFENGRSKAAPHSTPFLVRTWLSGKSAPRKATCSSVGHREENLLAGVRSSVHQRSSR